MRLKTTGMAPGGQILRVVLLLAIMSLLAGVFSLFAMQRPAHAANEDESESGVSVTVEIEELDETGPDPDPEDPDVPDSPGPDVPDSPDPDHGDTTPPGDKDSDAESDTLPRTGFGAGAVLWIAFGLVAVGAAIRTSRNVSQKRKQVRAGN